MRKIMRSNNRIILEGLRSDEQNLTRILHWRVLSKVGYKKTHFSWFPQPVKKKSEVQTREFKARIELLARQKQR